MIRLLGYQAMEEMEEMSTVRNLKQHLGQLYGIPRFRHIGAQGAWGLGLGLGPKKNGLTSLGSFGFSGSGVQWCRQRLLHNGKSLEDTMALHLDMDLQVVFLHFSDSSREEAAELTAAVEHDCLAKLGCPVVPLLPFW